MVIKGLLKRHILLYIRDRWAIFFSFLSVLIILGLFMIFLRNSFGGDFGDLEHSEYLIHTWIFSGVLMVSTVTVPLGFLAVMVQDLELKIINDFYVAPIKRKSIVASYFLAAVIVGTVFSLFNLLIGQVYIGLKFGFFLEPLTILRLIGLIIFSSMLFSALFFYITSYIKTSNAHGTLGTLVGTLIGFLAGLYVPIGVLGQTLRNILSSLPTMQMASLFRIVYMEESLNKTFVGIDAFRENMESFLGVSLEFSGNTVSPITTFIILSLWIVGLLLLSVRRLNTFKRH